MNGNTVLLKGDGAVKEEQTYEQTLLFSKKIVDEEVI
jgi:hypothetical protein